MAARETRGEGRAGSASGAGSEAADGSEVPGAPADGREVPGAAAEPTLRGLVSSKVADLFARMEANEIDSLYRLVVGEVEGSLLEAVMRETGGKKGRAARLLGINRGTLRKKLRAHGLI